MHFCLLSQPALYLVSWDRLGPCCSSKEVITYSSLTPALLSLPVHSAHSHEAEVGTPALLCALGMSIGLSVSSFHCRLLRSTQGSNTVLPIQLLTLLPVISPRFFGPSKDITEHVRSSPKSVRMHGAILRRNQDQIKSESQTEVL